ncbi:MAG TPA: hypothetical protein VIL86_05790 [Tepidisphaeraceae bacterium]
MLIVTGNAGVGKSTLTRAWASQCRGMLISQHPVRLHQKVTPRGGGMSEKYKPWVDSLANTYRVTDINCVLMIDAVISERAHRTRTQADEAMDQRLPQGSRKSPRSAPVAGEGRGERNQVKEEGLLSGAKVAER